MKLVYLVYKGGILVRIFTSRKAANKMLLDAAANGVNDLCITEWEVNRPY